LPAAGAEQSAYATAGIGAAAVAGLTGVGEAYLSTKISQSIVATLRRQFSGRLLDQPVGSFTDRRAGDLLSRINCSARPRAPG
jgi:ABC-type multidrug transport system fused ATPase/permease subunit